MKISDLKPSVTSKIETQMGTLYMTVIGDPEKPEQVLLNLGKTGAEANYLAESLARAISLGLAAGVPLQEFAKAFVHIGGSYDPPTVPDAIAQIIGPSAKEGNGSYG